MSQLAYIPTDTYKYPIVHLESNCIKTMSFVVKLEQFSRFVKDIQFSEQFPLTNYQDTIDSLVN